MPEHDGLVAGRWAEHAVRLLYLLAAIALLWVALRRQAAFLQSFQTRFEFHIGTWATFVGTLLLAGLSAGFAVRLPARGPYSWGRALILIVVPFLFLVSVLLFAMEAWTPPGWLFSFVSSFVVQTGLALLLGLAIAAGFRARPD